MRKLSFEFSNGVQIIDLVVEFVAEVERERDSEAREGLEQACLPEERSRKSDDSTKPSGRMNDVDSAKILSKAGEKTVVRILTGSRDDHSLPTGN